jgi:hypothetical protein
MENIKEYIPGDKYYSNNIHTLGKYQNISKKILMKMTCELIFKTPVYHKNSFHIDIKIFSNFLYGDDRNINKEIFNFWLMILSKYRKPSKVSKIFVIKDQKKKIFY